MNAWTETNWRGRFFTIWGGQAASLFGSRSWYVAAGVVCILTGVAGFFIPAVMTIEENRRDAGPEGGSEPAAEPAVTSP
jgi:hypothetical protein